MNSKLKAGLYTLGFGVFTLVVGISLQQAAQHLTQAQVLTGLAVAGITACFYTIYSILCAKFEYEETLKRMVDKK